ncbi:MAG: hypothetical protein WDN69_21625 [Aliidongia sp.]
MLKGPQGALYGRNAEGGAINITTQQPTDEFEGKLFTGFGNGGQVDGGGVLSGPIVKDQLLFRIAAEDSNFDGLIPNDYLQDKGRSLYRAQRARRTCLHADPRSRSGSPRHDRRKPWRRALLCRQQRQRQRHERADRDRRPQL